MRSEEGEGFRKEGDGGAGKKKGKKDAQKVLRYCFREKSSLSLTEFWGKLGEFCEKLGEFALAHQ